MRNIIDTSSLASANRIDFPMAERHAFWDWLIDLGKNGKLTIPQCVYEELGAGSDALPTWLHEHKSIFYSPTAEAIHSVPAVLEEYGNEISEVSLERMGVDPLVIAHAVACSGRVISNEAPRPNATAPHKKKIPSVCTALGVECWSLSRLVWELR